MYRIILLSLCLCVSTNASAFLRHYLLKKMEGCQLVSDEPILAGSLGNVSLAFELSNGRKIYSERTVLFGFSDVRVNILRGGSIGKISNRKLTVKADYDVIEDPYIHIHVQMIKKPSLQYYLSIPVHFNGTFLIKKDGLDGQRGARGEAGYNGNIGKSYEHSADGESGGWGSDGYTGYPGENGRNGENVSVYVSMVELERDKQQILRIESFYENGLSDLRYVDKKGKYQLFLTGGDGGKGGRGGAGGIGGSGGIGAVKGPASEYREESLVDGVGGAGGHGGNGGRGGPGGNAGKGGSVDLFITKEALPYSSVIEIHQSGGIGGIGGIGGASGKGGNGGVGGNGRGENGIQGRKGGLGKRGMDGEDGVIRIHTWTG